MEVINRLHAQVNHLLGKLKRVLVHLDSKWERAGILRLQYAEMTFKAELLEVMQALISAEAGRSAYARSGGPIPVVIEVPTDKYGSFIVVDLCLE